MSPRSFTCPTCNAAPLVPCDDPDGLIHLARADMANRAEKAAAGKRDADWNVSNLYAEKPDPEPERNARAGKQTTIMERT